MQLDIDENQELDELIEELPTPPDRSSDQLLIVDYSKIHRDPNQPRRVFNEKTVDELASSIKARGLIEPIKVRPHPTIFGQYMIVDGERRWRACGLVELDRVQVLLRAPTDAAVVMDQLTANWHREGMTPLDEAEAIEGEIERLRLEGHQNPREKVRIDLGVSRSVLSKKLAVLKYPKEIRDLLTGGHIRDYQTVKNLSMLKSDVQSEMIERVKQGGFNAKEFNKNPQKYIKTVKKEAHESETVGREQTADLETQAKTTRRFAIRWVFNKEVLATLIANTPFNEVMDGVNIMELPDDQAKAVFEKFKEWLVDPGDVESQSQCA